MKGAMRVVIGLLLAGLTIGCSTRPVVESLAELGAADAVLVGRIKLSPPLEEDEQTESRGVWVAGEYQNMAFIATANEPREPEYPPGLFAYSNCLKVRMGHTFYLRVPQAPLYLVQGQIPLHFGGDDGRGMESAQIPAGFKVDIQKGDRAVYIGTIHYQRDEFWKITQVTIEDDYDQALAEFRRKLGPDAKLRKALLKSDKAPARRPSSAARRQMVLERSKEAEQS